jgi:hypothetical protein
VSSKPVILDAHTEDTKYVFMPREQNSEENYNLNIGYKSF